LFLSINFPKLFYHSTGQQSKLLITATGDPGNGTTQYKRHTWKGHDSGAFSVVDRLKELFFCYLKPASKNTLE
jgi:hypothetical protein